jgi:serine/threonine protein kinase
LKNIPYDQSADMWSVGVTLYFLLCGHPPFADENQGEMFRKIRTAEFDFWGEAWESVSDEAKDLIRGLLVPNPIQRLTAKEALHSAWLRHVDESLTEADLAQNAETPDMCKSRLKNTSKAVRRKSSKKGTAKVESGSKHVEHETKPRRKGSAKTVSVAKEFERTTKPRKDLGPVHLRKFEC